MKSYYSPNANDIGIDVEDLTILAHAYDACHVIDNQQKIINETAIDESSVYSSKTSLCSSTFSEDYNEIEENKNIFTLFTECNNQINVESDTFKKSIQISKKLTRKLENDNNNNRKQSSNLLQNLFIKKIQDQQLNNIESQLLVEEQFKNINEKMAEIFETITFNEIENFTLNSSSFMNSKIMDIIRQNLQKNIISSNFTNNNWKCSWRMLDHASKSQSNNLQYYQNKLLNFEKYYVLSLSPSDLNKFVNILGPVLKTRSKFGSSRKFSSVMIMFY